MLHAQQAAGTLLYTALKLDNIPQIPKRKNFPRLIPKAPTSPFWLQANRIGLAGEITIICLNGA